MSNEIDRLVVTGELLPQFLSEQQVLAIADDLRRASSLDDVVTALVMAAFNLREGDGAALMVVSAPRSGAWPRVRAEHIKKFPFCAACEKRNDLEVHHVIPFSQDERLELDPNNLITLCVMCHLVMGHFKDYRDYNPGVRKMAADYNKALRLHRQALGVKSTEEKAQDERAQVSL